MMGRATGAGEAGADAGPTDKDGFEAAINQGADAFTKQLEESGIPPGDFLKQLLADVMAEEGEGGAGSSKKEPTGGSGGTSGTGAGAGAGAGQQPESFNDAIQRTMHRMQESGDKATAAASSDDTDDIMAQLMKAVEAGASGAGGEDGDLSKMFMGMMEQLSNKEMLYEPMKELDGKFGPWIARNKREGNGSGVSGEDMERYETQARVVGEIVAKFEEKGYTDQDPKCRDYIWEKMQEVCVY